MAKSTKKDVKEQKHSPEKMDALNSALAGIEKQFGKGSIMRLGDNKTNENIEVIPTGSLGLDAALGISTLIIVLLISSYLLLSPFLSTPLSSVLLISPYHSFLSLYYPYLLYGILSLSFPILT